MEWIKYSEEKPTQRGFYLIVGEQPYSSWSFIDKKDRYPDHIAYAFFDGNTFNATSVVWWMPIPEKPEGWDKMLKDVKKRLKWPEWKQRLYNAGMLDYYYDMKKKKLI
jgi:hypothetical protein